MTPKRSIQIKHSKHHTTHRTHTHTHYTHTTTHTTHTTNTHTTQLHAHTHTHTHTYTLHTHYTHAHTHHTHTHSSYGACHRGQPILEKPEQGPTLGAASGADLNICGKRCSMAAWSYSYKAKISVTVIKNVVYYHYKRSLMCKFMQGELLLLSIVCIMT